PQFAKTDRTTLLDYNRKQADSAVELENVELAPLVETVVSAHYSLPARAKMTMHIPTSISKQQLQPAEPMLLMSVLDNLYSNAVHYGLNPVTFAFAAAYMVHGFILMSSIQAHPFRQEERAMIFEPFFQGSHQRKRAVKGSGLGLSIARDCIAVCKGNCIWSTRAGQDVRFRIELPSSKNTK
ncbi:sensor histidine kinase, partial [Escherichia coli]|uniref:sensor histidine kinase n=1 Tax=Escherichia coli TaxID=562 RepID=UPI0022387987